MTAAQMDLNPWQAWNLNEKDQIELIALGFKSMELLKSIQIHKSLCLVESTYHSLLEKVWDFWHAVNILNEQ